MRPTVLSQSGSGVAVSVGSGVADGGGGAVGGLIVSTKTAEVAVAAATPVEVGAGVGEGVTKTITARTGGAGALSAIPPQAGTSAVNSIKTSADFFPIPHPRELIFLDTFHNAMILRASRRFVKVMRRFVACHLNRRDYNRVNILSQKRL